MITLRLTLSSSKSLRRKCLQMHGNAVRLPKVNAMIKIQVCWVIFVRPQQRISSRCRAKQTQAV